MTDPRKRYNRITFYLLMAIVLSGPVAAYSVSLYLCYVGKCHVG